MAPMRQNHLLLRAWPGAWVAALAACLVSDSRGASNVEPRVASGQQAIAATGHPLATGAAVEALRRGGNAIDGAVAAALTLGVVDGHNSGLGGGCLMLIRLADGRFVAIDGRETAPAAAFRTMFVRDGQSDTRLSQTGPLAMGVPGALAAYDHALTNYGRLPLRAHLDAAALLAQNGFRLSRIYAHRLATNAPDLRLFDASRAVFFKPDGSVFLEGDVLTQADLAATYRAIALAGASWFYQGSFAVTAGDWARRNGGLVRELDFRNYQARLRAPVVTTYRGCRIVGFSPPSSGGVLIAQMLGMLEQFNLKSMGAGSADFIHVVTEAMKLAFADRAAWLGDPDYGGATSGTLDSKAYARERAKQIRVDRAMPPPQSGTPGRTSDTSDSKHTTHFSVADAEGNWVACTATINTSFGSKVIIPGTGVVMNNQMDDFALAPGLTNYFGLLGGEANAVHPQKRPLSSMSPTLVLKEGQPILCVGAAGGPTIISQTLLATLYTIDFGMPLDQALVAVRFHHQGQPDELRIEKAADSKVLRELERRGHRLKLVDAIGTAQAVGWDVRKRALVGAADPRGEGNAGGF
jgi:gamma-glutamyltranspeptidase / glutathione hydrolase